MTSMCIWNDQIYITRTDYLLSRRDEGLQHTIIILVGDIHVTVIAITAATVTTKAQVWLHWSRTRYSVQRHLRITADSRQIQGILTTWWRWHLSCLSSVTITSQPMTMTHSVVSGQQQQFTQSSVSAMTSYHQVPRSVPHLSPPLLQVTTIPQSRHVMPRLSYPYTGFFAHYKCVTCLL